MAIEESLLHAFREEIHYLEGGGTRAGVNLHERIGYIDLDALKVDVPEGATLNTPWRLTRLSRQHYVQVILDEPHPRSALEEGHIAVCVDEATLEPGSDIYALVREKIVSVTPLSLDATSRTPFTKIRDCLGL